MYIHSQTLYMWSGKQKIFYIYPFCFWLVVLSFWSGCVSFSLSFSRLTLFVLLSHVHWHANQAPWYVNNLPLFISMLTAVFYFNTLIHIRYVYCFIFYVSQIRRKMRRRRWNAKKRVCSTLTCAKQMNIL